MYLIPSAALLLILTRDRPARHRGNERGQATTEYALVLLGAAAIALLLVAWATKTGAFGSLLDAVLDSIKKKV